MASKRIWSVVIKRILRPISISPSRCLVRRTQSLAHR